MVHDATVYNMLEDLTLNDTYNATDRYFAIFSKLFKILIRNSQESEKNISIEL